jgi:hypothetical protein
LHLPEPKNCLPGSGELKGESLFLGKGREMRWTRLRKMKKSLRPVGGGSCHSLNGVAGVGPTWLGLFGGKVVLADSTAVTADIDYLHRSILEPEVQLLAGYANVMPASYGQQLSETEMTELIDLIQLLVKAEE